MSAGVTCPVCDRGGLSALAGQVAPHGHVYDPEPCPGSRVRVLSGSVSDVLTMVARDAANGELPGDHNPETCEQVLAGVREFFGALAVGVAVGDFHAPGHVFGDVRDLVRDLGYVLGEVTI